MTEQGRRRGPASRFAVSPSQQVLCGLLGLLSFFSKHIASTNCTGRVGACDTSGFPRTFGCRRRLGYGQCVGLCVSSPAFISEGEVTAG